MTEATFRTVVETPIGPVALEATRSALVGVRLPGSRRRDALPPAAGGEVPPVLARAARELAEYFDGRRRDFTVPLGADGTEFQRAVWDALRGIPYGATISYAALAARAGRPAACRAAGGANGRNPLPIFVPCHRVVAADGSIGGYSAGVEAKRRLLDLERRTLGLPPFP